MHFPSSVEEAFSPNGMNAFDVLLSIKGAHMEGSTESATEFLTEGRLLRDAGRCIIEFDETELSGIRDTVTRLMLEGDDLWLIRTGTVESQFRFQERQLYETAFHTPMGLLHMSILPLQVLSRLDSEEGGIDLEYIIKVGEDSALNRLSVHYRLRN